MTPALSLTLQEAVVTYSARMMREDARYNAERRHMESLAHDEIMNTPNSEHARNVRCAEGQDARMPICAEMPKDAQKAEYMEATAHQASNMQTNKKTVAETGEYVAEKQLNQTIGEGEMKESFYEANAGEPGVNVVGGDTYVAISGEDRVKDLPGYSLNILEQDRGGSCTFDTACSNMPNPPVLKSFLSKQRADVSDTEGRDHWHSPKFDEAEDYKPESGNAEEGVGHIEYASTSEGGVLPIGPG
jgi:hypothetical protein